jgi:hypothetical protein
MSSDISSRINLICNQHKKPQTFICLNQDCCYKIGCSKCYKLHSKETHFTYSIEEVLDDSMIQNFKERFTTKFWELAGKIRVFVRNMEEVYVKYLETIFHQLEKCFCMDDYFKNVSEKIQYRFQCIFNKESKICYFFK